MIASRDNGRLYAGAATAVVLAAIGGFSIARFTLPAPVAEAPKAAASDSVAIDAQGVASAGIAVTTVAAGGFAAEVSARALVVASPGGQAVLTAPAAGAVTRIFKRLGDPVRAGEALALVSSREAAQIAADRSAANAKAVLAQQNLVREKSLFDQRVSPRMDYEVAQAEAAAARAEAGRAQAAAGAAHVSADGRAVVVTSPIDGRVTAASVALGAYVQPETELFRVADPRQVQVEAQVSALDAGRIAPGDRAVLETGAGAIEARVRAITPSLDPQTRAATAVLDVPAAGLTGGQALRVRLFPKGAVAGGGIVVPEEAVQTVGGREAVFVRTAQGFKAQPVQVGQRSGGRAEIIGGLNPGQVIATRNAFLLRAELGKAEGAEE